MTEDIPPPPYKVVLLGDSSVGKTSLVHRFTTNSFDQYTSNTIGAAFITKEYQSHHNAEKKIKFEIWDTAGQERYRSLTPMYYRNSKTALVCFDLSNFEDTFEKAQYWTSQLLLNSNNEANESIKIKLIGTKKDLVKDKDFDSTRIKEFCEENKFTFYETSAKTGSGVTEIFNDIIDEIEDSFFEDYENQVKIQQLNNAGHIGTINFLNARSKNGNCC